MSLERLMFVCDMKSGWNIMECGRYLLLLTDWLEEELYY